MLDMQTVGRKIAARRKAAGMTQTALADAMGVSFQAVSNWERGQSMPDIAKLPELAGVLGTSIDELLDGGAPMQLIRHVIDGDARAQVESGVVDVETIAEAAPVLPPVETEKLLNAAQEHADTPLSFGSVATVAPFVSDDFLHKLVLRAAQGNSASGLAALLPFLGDAQQQLLVQRINPALLHAGTLATLAPLLKEEALAVLVGRCADAFESLGDAIALAPFLPEKLLDQIVRSAVRRPSFEAKELVGIAAFLPEDTFHWLVEEGPLRDAAPETLVPLAPFMPKALLTRLAESIMAKGNLSALAMLAPFL